MGSLLTALGLAPLKGTPGRDKLEAGTDAEQGDKLSEVLLQWRQNVQTVIVPLQKLSARVAKSTHKDAKGAYIEIQAVIKNLAREPRTLEQVQELESWLREDAVVADVDELECKLRTPLLAQLVQIRDCLQPRST